MATLTCHTEGCDNQDESIDYPMLWTDETGTDHLTTDAVCGRCGEPITDLVMDAEEEAARQ